MSRIRIGKDSELSLVAGSIVVTDSANEQGFLAPGAEGTIPTIVAGVPVWQAPATQSFTISDGVNTQTIANGDTFRITQGNGLTATVSATDILTLAAKLSADAGNDIAFGTDGGLYLSKNSLLTGVTWNDTTNNLVLTFDDGSVVNVPIMDTLGSLISDFTIGADFGTPKLIPNHGSFNILGGSGINTSIDGSGNVTANISISSEFFTNLTSGNTVTLPLVTPTIGFFLGVYRNGIDITTDGTWGYNQTTKVMSFSTAFGSSTGGAGTESVRVVYLY
jgi:hypothetical protein